MQEPSRSLPTMSHSTWNPKNTDHIAEICESNNLETTPPPSIIMASWAKAIENCSNSQRSAHLYLTFSNIDLANKAIKNSLSICNKRCHIKKCRKELLRCLKCQGWNHLAKDCIEMDDTCGNCTGKHRTRLCTSTEKKCASCKTNNHASWCRQCPTFIKKLTELNARNLENSTIYFPSNIGPSKQLTPCPTLDQLTP